MLSTEQASWDDGIHSDATEMNERINFMECDGIWSCIMHLKAKRIHKTELVAAKNKSYAHLLFTWLQNFFLVCPQGFEARSRHQRGNLKNDEDTLPTVGPRLYVHIGFVSDEGKANPVNIWWAKLWWFRGDCWHHYTRCAERQFRIHRSHDVRRHSSVLLNPKANTSQFKKYSMLSTYSHTHFVKPIW